MYNITGIQLVHVSSEGKTMVMGDIDLHDYGTWHEHRMDEGDHIIGMYGLQNNLVRGLGFILMNVKPSQGFMETLKGRMTCLGDSDAATEAKPLKNADEPNYVSDEMLSEI